MRDGVFFKFRFFSIFGITTIVDKWYILYLTSLNFKRSLGSNLGLTINWEGGDCFE